MLNYKNTFASNFFSYKSEKIFGYELFFGLVTFSLLLVGFSLQLASAFTHFGLHFDYDFPDLPVAKQDKNHLQYLKIDPWTSSVEYFSFFTVQTNLLCATILVLSAVRPQLLGKKKVLRPNFVLAVSIYISMTSIVFNTFLTPYVIFEDKITQAIPWFYLTWEHTILPVAFVCWFIFLYPIRTFIDVWQHKKTWFGKLFIYPIIYLLVFFLRGIFLRDMVLHTTTTTHSNDLIFFHSTNNINNLFLYYMLNVFDSNLGVPGYAWFLLVVFVQVNILVWGTYFYQQAFNKRTSKQPATT